MAGEFRNIVINGREYDIRANRFLNFIFNHIINYRIFGTIYMVTGGRINL